MCKATPCQILVQVACVRHPCTKPNLKVLGSFGAARAAEMKSFPLKQPKLGNFLLYFCECARYVSEMASKNHFHNVVWFGLVRFG